MKFSNWLENVPDTQEYTPDYGDPNRTTEYIPDDERAMGIGTIRGYGKILSALRQIDDNIPDPDPSNYRKQFAIRRPSGTVDSGFAGTPDYAAPEAFELQTNYQQDNYERTLLGSIPQLFPELSREAKQLAQLWVRFRNKVIQQSGLSESIRPPLLRPIHYALPLMQMQSVQQTLNNIARIIQTSPDLKPELLPEFSEIQRRHVDLFHKVGPSLQAWLASSRNNPASYEPEPSSVAEPAA